MANAQEATRGATPQTKPVVLDRMLAMWNERDPDQVRGYVDSVLSEDVIFIDPANSITGRDAFEEMVKKFRAGAPEAVCQRSSGVRKDVIGRSRAAKSYSG